MSVETNKLHKILSHCGENHLEATANIHGVKVIGKIEEFESFTISKEKKKKTRKIWTGPRNVLGESSTSILAL
jgi:sRNA-binding regulator protein Hfq